MSSLRKNQDAMFSWLVDNFDKLKEQRDLSNTVSPGSFTPKATPPDQMKSSMRKSVHTVIPVNQLVEEKGEVLNFMSAAMASQSRGKVSF